MDRYSVLSISIVILILIFASFNVSEEDDSITGFADQIKSTDSGYTFMINDGNGNSVKSFSSVKPDSGLHEFSGSCSEDGSMFFVSKIE